MGIVLPEGVLNNTNLQRVRDFVESKAKIILITSIPQDVFMASGATVKPSLLFFRKFTEAETNQWHEIEAQTRLEVAKKYHASIAEARKPLSNAEEELKERNESLRKVNQKKGRNQMEWEKLKKAEQDAKASVKVEKKAFGVKEKELNRMVKEEIKERVKERFDYEIAIAEVDKAGISPTGATIANELVPLSKEFKKYRKANMLWKSKFEKVVYEIMEDNTLFRTVAGERHEIYG